MHYETLNKSLSWLNEMSGSCTPAPPDNVELFAGSSNREQARFVWLRGYNDVPPQLWPGCERVYVGDGYVVDEVISALQFNEWRYPKTPDETAPDAMLKRIMFGRNLAYNSEADAWKPQTK